MCRFLTLYVPSIRGFRFGHQLVVSIDEYLLLLVLTILECILTLTTKTSNFFLDPICAVHLDMSRQFLASVFGKHF